LVRNPAMPARSLPLAPELPATASSAGPDSTVMVDVVVLSGDVPLYDAIRLSVGERNPVWRARSAEEAVDLLMTGRCGVLLIDMAAVSTRPATLIEQIVDQFPDVVVVVAGRREDESVLAGLISDGLVYRFMHKPLSPKRAGMFLNAAMRSHVERRAGRQSDPLLPLVRELRSRVDPRKWLFVGGGLLLFLLLIAAFLLSRHGPDAQQPPAATAVGASVPLADPVLSRARAALAAKRYESPPGRNALDLYAAALLTRPEDPEARDGLATTITHLLANAEKAIERGDSAEARRLASRILKVDADNAGAHSLLDRLTPKPTAATIASPPAPVSTAPMVQPSTTGLSATLRDDSPLPVPVTRLAPVAPAAPAPQVVRQPLRVQPDPLTPRVAGTGVLPTSPQGSARRPVARRYDLPEPPALPIAGYVTSQPELAAGVAPAPAVEPPADAGVQSRALEPIATPEPVYPPEAFRAGIEGWAEVDFTVNERGVTRDIVVVASAPRGVFDDAAIAAVAAWKYRPRIVNGRPLPERSTVTLRFNVDD
jgi:protein TonB